MQARTLSDLSSQLQSQLQDMQQALSDFGRSIKAGIGSSMNFAKDTTRATYNIAGKHLLPIEDEIFQDVNGAPPPSLGQLNGFGVAILALPVMLPVFLSSITWIPLIGNSIPSGIRSFTDLVNMPLFEITQEKQLSYRTILGIDTANDKRNFIRQLYGVPGALIGVVIGLPVATIIGGVRIVTNNAKSFIQTWVAFTNFALSENKQISLKDIIQDDRHSAKKYFIGGIGVFLGAVVGGISALAVALARGVWSIGLQSARSFKHAFANIVNLVVAEKYKIDIAKDERHWAKRFVLGGIGTLLGGIAGSISALAVALARGVWNLAYHSALTLAHTFAIIANKALPDDKQISLVKDQPVGKRYGFGLIGAILGGVTGSIAALAIALARGVWSIGLQSARSFKHAFANIVNLVVAEKYKIDIAKDERHWAKRFVLGGIGTLLGGIAGSISALAVALARGVWNLAYHSALTLAHTFAIIANKALPDDKQISLVKDQPVGKRYGFGLIGAILGGVTGSIAALAIALARGVWSIGLQSARSFKHAFANIVNLVVAEKYKIDIAKDERHWAKRFVLGGIGTLLGGIAGSISALAVALARGVWNLAYHSALTLAHTFAIIANKALPDDKQISLVKDQPVGKRYGFGLIGAILGGVTGSIAALAIALARGVWSIGLQSARSFKHAFANIVNLVVAEKYKIDIAKDERHWAKRFVLGGIGTLLGGIAGSISALVVALARGVWNLAYHSAHSLKHAFVHAINQAVAGDYEINIADDNRHWAKRFVFGGIGSIIGAVTGSISFVATLLARGVWNLAYHSALTLAHTFAIIANKALPDHKQISLVKDQPVVKRYGFGLIGAILGGVTGSIAALTIALARGVWSIGLQSARSFKHAFANIVNLVVAEKYKIDIAKDERHWVKRFVVGGIGTLLGGIAGSISALAVALARGVWNLAYHSALTLAHTFAIIANKALPDDKQIPLVKDQPVGKRYGFGLIGAMLGVVAGSIAALMIGSSRIFWSFANNTFHSWSALSGSMMNGAVNRPWFHGLGGDDRSTSAKCIGGIGYLFAALTTTPIAALIYLAKQTPLLIAGLVMLSLSPLVMLCKGFARSLESCCHIGARFGENDIDPMIQKFKNLYSSLSITGDFKENTPIVRDGSGKENLSLFFGKSLKLNLKSGTEKLLDALLIAYRQSDHQQDFFTHNNDEFNGVVQSIKDGYTLACFNTQGSVDDQHTKIDRVANFIKDYMNGFSTELEARAAPNTQPNWTATFFGNKKKVTLEPELQTGKALS